MSLIILGFITFAFLLTVIFTRRAYHLGFIEGQRKIATKFLDLMEKYFKDSDNKNIRKSVEEITKIKMQFKNERM